MNRIFWKIVSMSSGSTKSFYDVSSTRNAASEILELVGRGRTEFAYYPSGVRQETFVEKAIRLSGAQESRVSSRQIDQSLSSRRVAPDQLTPKTYASHRSDGTVRFTIEGVTDSIAFFGSLVFTRFQPDGRTVKYITKGIFDPKTKLFTGEQTFFYQPHRGFIVGSPSYKIVGTKNMVTGIFQGKRIECNEFSKIFAEVLPPETSLRIMGTSASESRGLLCDDAILNEVLDLSAGKAMSSGDYTILRGQQESKGNEINRLRSERPVSAQLIPPTYTFQRSDGTVRFTVKGNFDPTANTFFGRLTYTRFRSDGKLNYVTKGVFDLTTRVFTGEQISFRQDGETRAAKITGTKNMTTGIFDGTQTDYGHNNQVSDLALLDQNPSAREGILNESTFRVGALDLSAGVRRRSAATKVPTRAVPLDGRNMRGATFAERFAISVRPPKVISQQQPAVLSVDGPPYRSETYVDPWAHLSRYEVRHEDYKPHVYDPAPVSLPAPAWTPCTGGYLGYTQQSWGSQIF